MSRPLTLFLSGLLCVIASATAVAQSQPAITGMIQGHEVCPQFIEFCGERAWFAGKFVGQVGGSAPVSGSFLVGVSHGSPLNQSEGGTTPLTGGEWVIVIGEQKQLISGTVQPGGTLTYHVPPANAFDITLTLVIAHGPVGGTVNFRGLLAHNPFPPEVIGMFVP